jgi:uncharacterized protein YjiS (DUF1127 family)
MVKTDTCCSENGYDYDRFQHGLCTDRSAAAARGRPFRKYFGLLCEWHQRAALRGALYGMSDRQLQDIGTNRGEIEYVVRRGAVDRRGTTAV